MFKVTRCSLSGAAAIILAIGCSQTSSRDDFTAHLIDRTEEEVLRYAGKPDVIDDSVPNQISWIYRSRTVSKENGKTDEEAIVVFMPTQDGARHVSSVFFQ